MQLHSKSGFIFYNNVNSEYIIQYQDMKDPLQQSYRNIAFGAEIGRLFKMDYSAVSQAAKRFEQQNKVNHEIGKIKQKMTTALRNN